MVNGVRPAVPSVIKSIISESLIYNVGLVSGYSSFPSTYPIGYQDYIDR